MTWQKMDSAPRDGSYILGYGPEGVCIVAWDDGEDDGPDNMGHDAGWACRYWDGAAPGRSFGNPKYFREARNQPLRWMPLPSDPVDVEWDTELPF